VAPVEGCVSPVIVRDPVAWSVSVSFWRTFMVNGVSSDPVCVASVFATGASLTQLMVIVPVAMLDASGQKVSLAW
jgi:hypothetical protein